MHFDHIEAKGGRDNKVHCTCNKLNKAKKNKLKHKHATLHRNRSCGTKVTNQFNMFNATFGTAPLDNISS